jgi:hypothetical protein
MANQYYGIDRGETTKMDVTTGAASTATTDVEIRVDLAASMTREEVLRAIEVLKQSIYEANWPPA